MGKLLDSDYEEIDATLRAEALSILNEIEALEVKEREANDARAVAEARAAVDGGRSG